jgi:hypothetical protein
MSDFRSPPWKTPAEAMAELLRSDAESANTGVATTP